MTDNINIPSNLPEAITALSCKLDADLYVLSGEVSRGMADLLIESIGSSKEKDNVCLILTTYGGSADAAYIMAKTLKRFYNKFYLFVYGYCKSAGTLIALGADEIIMSIHAELGPLDVQLLKEDELGSQSSGLDIFKALDIINDKAFEVFEHTLLNVKRRSGGLITTKMASDIAVVMSTQLISPITAQIDPIKLGEVQRAIDIARQYGRRLGASEAVLNRLINQYPSHGFVIDIEEARELFPNVRPADEVETVLEMLLGNSVEEQMGTNCIHHPHSEGVIMPLHKALQQANNSDGDIEESHQVTLEPESKETIAESGEGIEASVNPARRKGADKGAANQA